MSRKNLAPGAKLSVHVESALMMGTMIKMWVVGPGSAADADRSITQAMRVMHTVETVCSRFDESSELRRLCQSYGRATPVSPILFHALSIALATSELTDGVFDPTIGRLLERQGFNRHYLTSEVVSTPFADATVATYRDVHLDSDQQTVRLDKPMALDLGAVAKGLAIDLAAKELEGWNGWAIDAGGDVRVQGVDPDNQPWTVAIEDPRDPSSALAHVVPLGHAVCTSGNHKRMPADNPNGRHLIHGVERHTADDFISMTVIAPLTVLADVAATAGFLLGPDRGLEFIASQGLAAYALTTDGRVLTTATIKEYLR